MRVDLYTISWNERRMLPFFLRHYEPWVTRFIVFDDGSDDGTAAALAAHPKVDLRPFPPKNGSFVLAARELWEHAWKESRGRADWVVCTNIDEFLVHPGGIAGYLDQCRRVGVTLVHPLGYEMVARAFPPEGSDLVAHLRRGVPMIGCDKRQVFNPNAIAAMNFMPGRHQCTPMGTVIEPRVAETLLLHYKRIDPAGYYRARQHALGARLLPRDRELGFGHQYVMTDETDRRSFAWLEMHATDVLAQAERAMRERTAGSAA